MKKELKNFNPTIISDTTLKKLKRDRELMFFYKRELEELQMTHQNLEQKYLATRAAGEMSVSERLRETAKLLSRYINEGVFLERKDAGLELADHPYETPAEELELSADFIKEMIDPNFEGDDDIFYWRFTFGRPMKGERVDCCPNCFEELEEGEHQSDHFFTVVGKRFCYRENEYYDQYCPKCGYELPSQFGMFQQNTILLEENQVTPELVVRILVHKYVHHCSLVSQSMILDKLGVSLSAATIAGWLRHACEKWLIPLHGALLQELFKEDVLYMESLTLLPPSVDVFADEPEMDQAVTVWAFQTSAFCRHRIVLFDISTSNTPSGRMQEMLRGYSGTLVTGCSHFSQEETENCTCAGSWFVLRLMFEDALEDGAVYLENLTSIKEGAELCQALYAVEEKIESFEPDVRQFIREKESVPLVDELVEWARHRLRAIGETEQTSSATEAAHYILNYEESLRKFLYDGRLEIDHKCIVDQLDRMFGDEETGWTFTGAKQYAGLHGGIAALSVMQTAYANHLDPERYYLFYIRNMYFSQNDPEKISEFFPWEAPDECDLSVV